jgi:hypothetical protein
MKMPNNLEIAKEYSSANMSNKLQPSNCHRVSSIFARTDNLADNFLSQTQSSITHIHSIAFHENYIEKCTSALIQTVREYSQI